MEISWVSTRSLSLFEPEYEIRPLKLQSPDQRDNPADVIAWDSMPYVGTVLLCDNSHKVKYIYLPHFSMFSKFKNFIF